MRKAKPKLPRPLSAGTPPTHLRRVIRAQDLVDGTVQFMEENFHGAFEVVAQDEIENYVTVFPEALACFLRETVRTVFGRGVTTLSFMQEAEQLQITVGCPKRALTVSDLHTLGRIAASAGLDLDRESAGSQTFLTLRIRLQKQKDFTLYAFCAEEFYETLVRVFFGA